tara:strand:- start:567 stop:1103 length:537 start_codon:yes stop_codon:yes gene_type:complete
MTIINDGSNKNGTAAAVSKDQRLDVSSKANKRIFYVSRDDGRAFVWTSTFATGGSDVEVLYIKNDSTSRDLYIDSAHYSATAACVFTVQKHTGTASGTTNTGVNLNSKSSNDAEATSLGNGAVTAGTIGDTLAFLSVGAAAAENRNWNGEIILGQGDSIVITASANTTIFFSATGFYE